MQNRLITTTILWVTIFSAGGSDRLAAQEKTRNNGGMERQRMDGNQSKLKSRRILINRVQLTEQEMAALEQRYRIRLQDGAYWYDKMSGAWGIEGGPTVGFGAAGLSLGGTLRADASGGNTRVFINGRELHSIDVLGLSQLGPVYPGRYWVDAAGNCGFEGGPAFVNLVQLANAHTQRGSGGAWSYANGSSWIGSDGNGGMFFQGKDLVGNSGFASK